MGSSIFFEPDRQASPRGAAGAYQPIATSMYSGFECET